MPQDHIFLGQNGRVLETDGETAKWAAPIQAGQVLIDGSGIGDVGTAVLRDRKLLSEDGLIALVATIDREEGLLLAGPEIVSRGFVYVKEAGDLMEEIRALSKRTLIATLSSGNADWNAMKNALRDELSRYLYKKTRRRPMILPMLLEV